MMRGYAPFRMWLNVPMLSLPTELSVPVDGGPHLWVDRQLWLELCFWKRNGVVEAGWSVTRIQPSVE
uniref:Uncharacterized protein n=1 Tax=Parascaris equorum TaxID=6256 RepID=A0A914RHN5_PAREQ